MEKYYNEKGEVGVIISPGYGAGWSTWNGNNPELVFNKQLVEAVLNVDKNKILELAQSLCPDGYFGGASNLRVKFLTTGTSFFIDEYDGAESITFYEPGQYFTA